MNILIPTSRKHPIRQNSQTSQNSPTLASPPIFVEEKEEFLFEKEIADLMKSHGDSIDYQEMGSVHLIERILKREIHGIFQEACRIADQRRGTFIPILEDFEYIMRKNPVRVSRMKKTMQNMENIQKIIKNPAAFQGDRSSLEIMFQLWMPAELYEYYDEEKYRRLFRSDRLSLLLSPQNLQKFTMAKKSNLLNRSRTQITSMKFKKLLNIPDDYDFNDNLCQIISYLANETILILIDYAILTRLNSDNRNVDPYSRTANNSSLIPNLTEMNMCTEVSQGRGSEAAKAVTEAEILEGYRRFRYMQERTRSRMDKGLYFLAC